MNHYFSWRRTLAVAGVLLLALAGSAMAQSTSGNLYGVVTDNQGEPLPGVTVTLSGQGAPQIQVTNAEGQFRFLGLSPGGYQLTAELEGFSTVEYPNIRINVGRNTSIEVQLSPAVEETITVTSESPLLDERKIGTGSTITSVELEKIPTARDPWVILQGVPGVLTDRINVGGEQSGQQSNFVGNGSGRGSATWKVDGVEITDPAARGATPTYYDFDAFEEFQIGTGGTDINAMTPGVQLNLVTKRGTNDWRVSGRYLVTDNSWQSNPSVSNSLLGQAGQWNGGNSQASISAGNSTESVDDYGLEVGGPLVKDRLWIWGSYAFQDIKAFVLGQGSPIPDDTELENYAAKLNAQLSSNNSAVGFYHYGDKRKSGRGAGPQRPVETTWNQDGPTDIYKLEDTHIFSSNLYLTGMTSYVGGGFRLVPKSGLGTAPDTTRDAGRVWRNSFLQYETVRPQDQARLDGSYFFNTGDTNHELKFGVGYRHSEVTSLTSWSNNKFIGLGHLGSFFTSPTGGPSYLGLAVHDVPVNDAFDQWNVLLQDTMTFGNVTANVGLRYDLQEPDPGSVAVGGNPFFPNEIPAFTKTAVDPQFEWETISPRLGLTYALGEERQTLLRASYARFVDQLGTGFFNDVGFNVYRTGYFWWYDNGDFVIQDNEVSGIFDVAGDPTVLANTATGLDPEVTDEVILGLEHALMPEFVVGLSATIRQNSDIVVDYSKVQENGNIRREQRSDYVQVGTVQGVLPDGNAYTEPVFALRDGVILDPARGFSRENSGLEEDYLGISATFNKRLSNRWMMRGHVTWSDWTNEGRDANSLPDPTRGVNTENGSQHLIQSAGSGSRSEVFINSTWAFNISGMYQIAPDRPWGFNVAADVNGREGFSVPYRVSVSGQSALTDDALTRSVLVAPGNDNFRNDDVILVNARVEKEFSFSDFGLTLGVDVFNLFNDNSGLQTESFLAADFVDNNGNVVGSVGSTEGDFLREFISPQILRVGARFSWN